MKFRLSQRLFWSIIIVIGTLYLPVLNAQPEEYATRLSTVPIGPADRGIVTGNGTARAVLDGRHLSISGMFQGMQGPATTAALHLSPATGVRGPAILEIEVTETASGTLSAALELSRDQVEALRAGRLYIQVHSQAAPEGNLWGWLLP